MSKLSEAQWLDRIKELNLLRSFPAMTTQEVADYMRLNFDAMRSVGQWARAHGIVIDGRPTGLERGVLTALPSPEELTYRLKHLDIKPASYLLERFGDAIHDWIRDWGLARLAPKSWAPARDTPVPLDKSQPFDFMVGDDEETQVGFRVYNEAEQQEAIAKTNYLGRYEMDDGMKAQLVESWMRIRRASVTVAESDLAALKALSALEKEWYATVGSLKVPEVRTAHQWDPVQAFIDAGPDYLAERGYREATACPNCGTLVFHWWPIYLNLVRALHWLREQTKGKLFARCQEILTEVRAMPLFRWELNDLGCAWSSKLVAGLFALRERHPTIALEEIEDLLADFFEVSPAIMDRRDPASPLNRIVVVDGQEIVIPPPE